MGLPLISTNNLFNTKEIKTNKSDDRNKNIHHLSLPKLTEEINQKLFSLGFCSPGDGKKSCRKVWLKHSRTTLGLSILDGGGCSCSHGQIATLKLLCKRPRMFYKLKVKRMSVTRVKLWPFVFISGSRCCSALDASSCASISWEQVELAHKQKRPCL